MLKCALLALFTRNELRASKLGVGYYEEKAGSVAETFTGDGGAAVCGDNLRMVAAEISI